MPGKSAVSAMDFTPLALGGAMNASAAFEINAQQVQAEAFAPDTRFTGWQTAGQPIDRPGWRSIEREKRAHLPRDAAPQKPHRAMQAADVVYRYDGTFAGFLCCVFTSFARRELPFAIWAAEHEQATLYPVTEIATEPAHADRVFRAYCRLMGGAGRRLLLTVFLSGEMDKELRLLRFLDLAFAQGPRTLALLGDAEVAPIYAMDRAIGHEVEHLYGFVRFAQADDMLGAVIHPKNYVLPLLQGHFCSRFPEEQFLIYDATHSMVLLHRDHRAQLLRLDAPLILPAPDENERYCQTLWKQFYQTLAIRQRENEALRRQHCPKRFWGDMTELRDLL